MSFDTALFEAVPAEAQEVIESKAMHGVYRTFVNNLDEFYPGWYDRQVEAGKSTSYAIPLTGEGTAFGTTVKPETVSQGIYNVLKANEDLKAKWRIIKKTDKKSDVLTVWIAHL